MDEDLNSFSLFLIGGAAGVREFISAILIFCLIVVIIIPVLIVFGTRLSIPPDDLRDIDLKLYDAKSKKIIDIDIEGYIKGVLAAEMPASFGMEALKAQAVVARTFTFRRLRELGGRGCERHSDADLCSDHRHCQAWISQIDALRKWGYIEAFPNWQRISQAVESTRGEMVVYNGCPIDAAYHSTSGGITANSEDVWSSYVPYLRSVECRFDRHSPYFTDSKSFTISQIADLLKIDAASFDIGDHDSGIIGAVERSPDGRVRYIEIGGERIKGSDLRLALGLRSTNFTWEITEDGVRFDTIGYGHGVGMSQYGADGMAREGWGYRDIITYFYNGVEIIQYDQV
jgi:stage II sporulation protein D